MNVGVSASPLQAGLTGLKVTGRETATTIQTNRTSRAQRSCNTMRSWSNLSVQRTLPPKLEEQHCTEGTEENRKKVFRKRSVMTLLITMSQRRTKRPLNIRLHPYHFTEVYSWYVREVISVFSREVLILRQFRRHQRF